VEGAGLDGTDPRRAQALVELDAGIPIERGAEDLASRDAAMKQVAHPLDEDCRLPAARGGDDLHHAVVGAGRTPLLRVQRRDRRRVRPLPRLLRRAIQAPGHVQRALQCVGVLEARVDEAFRWQPAETVLALDQDGSSSAPGRLQHVPVEGGDVVEAAQRDAHHRQLPGRCDTREPGLCRIVQRAAATALAPRRRDDVPAQHGEVDHVPALGPQHVTVHRGCPGQQRRVRGGHRSPSRR
jgi:hypothetical protein